MFERLIALFGQDRFTKLEKARVLVVGLGGVGGYALEALVRSGVKNITIVDGDVVEESNLNRQIISNNKNIGISKCEAAAERALSINKNANISIIYKFITEDNFNDLLVNKYDYVIDACDDVKVKLLLMKHANKYKLVSSMGTANKTDPSKLSITTLDKTSGDPLAKVMRRELRKRGINHLDVVTSTELPIKPISFEEGDERTPASSPFVPPSAGLLIASIVCKNIMNA